MARHIQPIREPACPHFKSKPAEPGFGAASRQPVEEAAAAILRRAAAPASLRPADLLQLQHKIGNRAVGHLLASISASPRPIQAKLTVNAEGDPYERDADLVANSPRMAAQRQPVKGMFGSTLEKKAPEEHLLQGKFATVQRPGPDEDELRHGQLGTAQRNGLKGEALLEGKAASSVPAAQRDSASAPTQNCTGLPDSLRAGIESLSGLSMDDVRVHYHSDQPAQLQALAYTQGAEIHVAPGQEQHVAHEAWHVVQQKQGRVRPTLQVKEGVSLSDDAELEHEADVMGAKASQMAPSEQSTLNFPTDGAPKHRFPVVPTAPQVYIQRVRRIKTGPETWSVNLHNIDTGALEECLMDGKDIREIEVINELNAAARVKYNGKLYTYTLQAGDEIVEIADYEHVFETGNEADKSSSSMPDLLYQASSPSIHGLQTGILNKEFKAQLEGGSKTITLPKGTFCAIISGTEQTPQVKIQVLRTPLSAKEKDSYDKDIDKLIMSKEGLVLDVPAGDFQAEPAFDVSGDVATGEKPGHDIEYQEVKGPTFSLFGGEPKPADIIQGLMGDCPYLAVLIALASSQSGRALLKSTIMETEEGYRVTFPKTDQHESKTISVSRWFPVKRYYDSLGENTSFAFAGKGNRMSKWAGDDYLLSNSVPLWPMIIEKALAMHPAANEITRTMQKPTGYGALEVWGKAHSFFGTPFPATTVCDPSTDSTAKCRELIEAGLKANCIVTIESARGASWPKVWKQHEYAIVELNDDDQVKILNPHGKDHLNLKMTELREFFNQISVSNIASPVPEYI